MRFRSAETNDHYSDRQLPDGKRVSAMKTGGFVHVDYDADAAALWAERAHTDAGISERPPGRLLVITAWRAYSEPPQDKPLALIDRRTVDPDDLILEKIVAPHATWNGYQLRHNSSQRFCWWSNMNRDEVLLFLQYQDDFGSFSAAPHTAFNHPGAHPGMSTRHSIEVRGYAFLPGAGRSN